MTGLVPVARPPACQDTDNDLDDERPMDEDECLDYADQEPLPFPTSTGELGLMEQLLSRFTLNCAGRWSRPRGGAQLRREHARHCPQPRGGPTGVQDLLSTALDSPTAKRPLDVPTVSAAPARGATSGGD